MQSTMRIVLLLAASVVAVGAEGFENVAVTNWRTLSGGSYSNVTGPMGLSYIWDISAGETHTVWFHLVDADGNIDENGNIQDKGLNNSGDLQGPQQYTQTFNHEGVYYVYCNHHPSMNYFLTIEGSLPPSPPPPPQPSTETTATTDLDIEPPSGPQPSPPEPSSSGGGNTAAIVGGAVAGVVVVGAAITYATGAIGGSAAKSTIRSIL